MDAFIIARAVHILAIVLWIGGVAFVTLVAIPAIRRQHPPAERLAAFHRLEEGFARQARLWVFLAGASGLWMIHDLALWDRFLEPRFWWMHAMVGLWLVFAAMLFVLEPLVLHRRMAASAEPARDFDRMARAHRLLLALALITIAGTAAGSRGLF